MPAISHEPLSALQVLCEELEYSELIDKAADTDDPYDRMVKFPRINIYLIYFYFFILGVDCNFRDLPLCGHLL